jgi:hypothetical protein
MMKITLIYSYSRYKSRSKQQNPKIITEALLNPAGISYRQVKMEAESVSATYHC